MHVHSAVPAWLQIAWAFAGVGVAVGGFLWIAFVFYPYIVWTKRIMRESLELGRQTAGILRTVQAEIEPVVDDVKKVVHDVRELLTEFRSKGDLGKISAALDRLSRDGDLEKTLQAIQAIPSKLDEVLKAGRKDLLKSL